jgi:hypothetical protein
VAVSGKYGQKVAVFGKYGQISLKNGRIFNKMAVLGQEGGKGERQRSQDDYLKAIGARV